MEKLHLACNVMWGKCRVTWLLEFYWHHQQNV